jgi:hypothetical protein
LTQDQADTFLYEDSKGLEGSELLLKALKANGGTSDPLIVQRRNGFYVVREGNRRLACLKRLKEEAHNEGIEGYPPDKFDKVSCAILPDNITEEDIMIFMGQLHVSGRKEWPTHDKAWLVWWMNGGNSKMPYSEIAKLLGMSKATVQKTIGIQLHEGLR